MLRLGIEHRLAVLDRFGERLFAEAGLTGGDAGEHVSPVRRAPGGDDDRLDICRGDQLLAGRVSLGANPRRDLVSLFRVDVADSDYARPRQSGGEAADVVLADHADADHADLQSHLTPLVH